MPGHGGAVLASRAGRAGELAARYGGEEFAVLLPHTDIGDASSMPKAFCESVRDRQIPHAQSDVSPYVTISVGVASMGDPERQPRARGSACRLGVTARWTMLVETADLALYRAKMSGRNRAVAAANDAAAAGEFATAT